MSVLGSVFLAIAIVVLTWNLAISIIRERRYNRELAAERAARQVAALEADLFRNPREWVTEAEQAVEAEQRPRGGVTPHESLSYSIGSLEDRVDHILRAQIRMDRKYAVALRQESTAGWMPQHFPWLYVSPPNATRKAVEIEGPEILAVTRCGAQVKITYLARSSGYTRVVAAARLLGGSWVGVASEAITGVLAFRDPFNGEACQVRLRATHTSGLPVTKSLVVNVQER